MVHDHVVSTSSVMFPTTCVTYYNPYQQQSMAPSMSASTSKTYTIGNGNTRTTGNTNTRKPKKVEQHIDIVPRRQLPEFTATPYSYSPTTVPPSPMRRPMSAPPLKQALRREHLNVPMPQRAPMPAPRPVSKFAPPVPVKPVVKTASKPTLIPGLIPAPIVVAKKSPLPTPKPMPPPTPTSKPTLTPTFKPAPSPPRKPLPNQTSMPPQTPVTKPAAALLTPRPSIPNQYNHSNTQNQNHIYSSHRTHDRDMSPPNHHVSNQSSIDHLLPDTYVDTYDNTAPGPRRRSSIEYLLDHQTQNQTQTQTQAQTYNHNQNQQNTPRIIPTRSIPTATHRSVRPRENEINDTKQNKSKPSQSRLSSFFSLNCLRSRKKEKSKTKSTASFKVLDSRPSAYEVVDNNDVRTRTRSPSRTRQQTQQTQTQPQMTTKGASIPRYRFLYPKVPDNIPGTAGINSFLPSKSSLPKSKTKSKVKPTTPQSTTGVRPLPERPSPPPPPPHRVVKKVSSHLSHHPAVKTLMYQYPSVEMYEKRSGFDSYFDTPFIEYSHSYWTALNRPPSPFKKGKPLKVKFEGQNGENTSTIGPDQSIVPSTTPVSIPAPVVGSRQEDRHRSHQFVPVETFGGKDDLGVGGGRGLVDDYSYPYSPGDYAKRFQGEGQTGVVKLGLDDRDAMMTTKTRTRSEPHVEGGRVRAHR